MRRVNEWIALRATLLFGSMPTFYLFFLYGFLPVLFPAMMVTLLYWSNTVQLWSLPLIMVGTIVLGRKAEKRAQEDHETVTNTLAELKQMHLDEQATRAEMQAAQVRIERMLQQRIGGR